MDEKEFVQKVEELVSNFLNLERIEKAKSEKRIESGVVDDRKSYC